MGKRRRSALSRSRARVTSFSFTSSSRRAASHSSRDTTSGRFPIVIAIPFASDTATVSRSGFYRPAPIRLGLGWVLPGMALNDPAARCRYLTWVGAYLLAALDPPDRREFVVHIRTCFHCRDEIVTLAELPSILARGFGHV
jgi:hypothetical protein